jgi:hypothetical protein
VDGGLVGGEPRHGATATLGGSPFASTARAAAAHLNVLVVAGAAVVVAGGGEGPLAVAGRGRAVGALTIHLGVAVAGVVRGRP